MNVERSAASGSPRWLRWTKAFVFVASAGPFVSLAWLGAVDRLGANPVEALSHATGLWALNFLCLTLAVTPLRRLSGLHALARFRRMLGLYVFFYASLHVIAYVWFDQGFDAAAIGEDIGKRPFIAAGFAAFVLLVLLAITSSRAIARRLGRRWQTLHRAIYAIGVLAIVHFWWMKAGKHDFAEPERYAAILLALLGWRVLHWRLPGLALARRTGWSANDA